MRATESILLEMSLIESSNTFTHFLFNNDFNMLQVAQNQRDQIIGMLRPGETQVEMAGVYGVHQSTVARIAARYRETGLTRDRARCGTPCETTRATVE